MGGFFVSRTWRSRRAMLVLLALEFALTVAVLTLFGIANPNLYRTTLWQEGGDLGYNSAPNTVLYAMANHKPVKIPLVWSQFITSWNLVISVLSMFIMLCKIPMFFMHVFYPIISLVVHSLEIALYAYSAYGQSGKDTIDPNRRSSGLPWYIGKSCSVSTTSQVKGYCMQAKAAFVLTCLMIVLFGIFFLVAIHSMIPTRGSRERHAQKAQAKADRKSRIQAMEAADATRQQDWVSNGQYWAQQGYVLSPSHPPVSPFTPGALYMQHQHSNSGPPTPQVLHPPPTTLPALEAQVDGSNLQWEMQNYPSSSVPQEHAASPNPPMQKPSPIAPGKVAVAED